MCPSFEGENPGSKEALATQSVPSETLGCVTSHERGQKSEQRIMQAASKKNNKNMTKTLEIVDVRDTMLVR